MYYLKPFYLERQIPEFIKKIADNTSMLKKVEIEKNNSCVVCSPSKVVEIKVPTVIAYLLFFLQF